MNGFLNYGKLSFLAVAQFRAGEGVGENCPWEWSKGGSVVLLFEIPPRPDILWPP